MGKPVIEISHKERIQQFIIFSNMVYDHPFVEKHKKGYTFQVSFNLSFKTNEGTVEPNFDEHHLETLLTRLRQFLYSNELFYYKEVYKSALELFGPDENLTNFYKKLDETLSMPFAPGGVVVISENQGKDLVGGRTLGELIEARLYSGAIHSERRVRPEPGSIIEGLVDNEPILMPHLNLDLAGAAVNTCGNIFRFRTRILYSARRADKVDIFPEMMDLNFRAKEQGF